MNRIKQQRVVNSVKGSREVKECKDRREIFRLDSEGTSNLSESSCSGRLEGNQRRIGGEEIKTLRLCSVGHECGDKQ